MDHLLPSPFHRKAQREYADNDGEAIWQEPVAVDVVKGLHDGVPQEGAYVFVVVYQVYSQDVGAGGYGEARYAGGDAVLVAKKAMKTLMEANSGRLLFANPLRCMGVPWSIRW